ncbi:MAG: TIGR04086 family membrane protein [Ruminococcaceae bacterium]|nr:TIGR04086 family membrane protein [Oscillospiraceae bacterium]
MNTTKINKNVQKKRKQRQSSTDPTANSGFLHTLKSALFGMAIGIASAFVLMTAGAFICYSSGDPNTFVDTVALISLYLSSLVCGFAAVKRNRSSALFCGTLSGILMMLFFIICSLFLGAKSEAAFKFPVSILLRVAIVAASVFGGYAGLKRGNNKKRIKKISR